MPPMSGEAGAAGVGGFVVADSISLAPPQAAELPHFVAPPLPNETAALGFVGVPRRSAVADKPQPPKKAPG